MIFFVPCNGISSTATYYNIYYPSSCYGFDTLPPDFLFAAAAPSVFMNKAACGQFVCVKCSGSSCRSNDPIRVKIVDLCPGCPGAFDLSEQAFSKIADTDLGVISIHYDKC